MKEVTEIRYIEATGFVLIIGREGAQQFTMTDGFCTKDDALAIAEKLGLQLVCK